MLFMVIEKFKDLRAVRERFTQQGRLLPDGVVYRMSWVDITGTRCFQIMEAVDAEGLRDWTQRWDDLVEFEIVPVMDSNEFWNRAQIR